jgi:hypothetical protein
MKNILLLIVIAASLASCKKDNTGPTSGPSTYNAWFAEADGAHGEIAAWGSSSQHPSVVINYLPCSHEFGNIYNIQIGDTIMAFSTGATSCASTPQSATIGAVRSDGTRVTFKTDTSIVPASLRITYIVKE